MPGEAVDFGQFVLGDWAATKVFVAFYFHFFGGFFDRVGDAPGGDDFLEA